MDIQLFWISFAAYFTATIFHVLFLGLNRTRLGHVAAVFMVAGLAAQTAALIVRSVHTGHVPLTNMYEYITMLAWFAGAAYIVSIFSIQSKIVQAITGPVIFMLYVSASLLPKKAEQQLVPALQSYWLQIHVSMAAASEAVFLVAFVSSLLYLIKAGVQQPNPGNFISRLPEAERLDQITYGAIVIGYPLFTLGALFAGAIWAYRAWGNFWSWDPKETSSLIVWIIYSVYLHVRLIKGWRGRATAFLSIAGFLMALFTFFSNMILGGLHSYGN
ncbi:MAG: c-type cytochrome biogenesis protein CcsB [Candidatus Raymondbacteria bacterium RifOxyA12_full_50_37]|uniref:C-type cytochrome biogenesis protein CcsB n=1 Tax=Candidatus Raymondbacteria bacterium RIFOXYD12_FULL_49_13 TaxID=1817890 RepID=A0A1F7F9Y5_UNCRA|nr:MAG: c-type cytochrome biogenesis protein CcsB [Candidatus Raymondbacteria bacterium RifOxyA12_full_50_37]OGJ87758.1 MAG: c-type cytochrome biogenesis protein CcsB [Candidatus Raymondbacteria bacterium RIFOXYA2_FULL_49_16]OGJ94747.1 MAG: c-type cytochrome biogenesis protein CcsB [Candidatus Raymondbacteria bacterium RifOxyB12_full_50_8]OGJ95636.1 MAG: c-type cytochrome biogenesis protein CcsB [Candidatus Raymondbacteria bacterium RIFOXYC2_FULL_50_21]OGK03408.1 MAG: c-type cytochrome biogenes